MKTLARIMKSIRDGSAGFKILNRLSPIEYIPGPEKAIKEYIKEHYPQGKAWRALSPVGRKIWTQFHPLFDQYGIQVIAYAGANEGTTALALNEAFPGREFFLFEPVPQTFDILLGKTNSFKNMHCVNIALGEEEEKRVMFVDDYSDASSLLPYEAVALEEYPFLGRQHNIKVPVRPLDLVMRGKNTPNVDLLLMDVQGYEDKVLLGAEETLKYCRIVISEMNLQAVYSGSSTFDSVYQKLIRLGFQLKYILNPMQGVSHQILQIDGVFVRHEQD